MGQLAGIILTAFALDTLLGDPRSGLHPVALLGRWANFAEKRCRALIKPPIIAGMAAWLVVTLPPLAVAVISVALAQKYWGTLAGVILAGVWLYGCIALRGLWRHAEAVRRPLQAGDLPEARRALAMIVSRDTENLTATEIARGAVESLGENLTDAVNSAVFWAVAGFLLGGAPLAAGLAVLLRAANTLDACWGYKSARYLYFGRFAAKADDVLHFIPARLALIAIALAAPLVKGRVGATLKTGWRHRRRHPSPNSAWGMAAFAGALGLRLGGPTTYAGITENNPYLGCGRAALTAADIGRAQRLALWSALVFAVLMLFGAALIK